MALPSKYKRSDDLIKWLASFYDEVSTAISSLATAVTNIATNTAAIAKLNTVVDLTSAVADYSLSVNETAKINITAASTPLNIAVTNGSYDFRIVFDPSTFAADSTFYLQINNADKTGAVIKSADRASTAFATDEVDTNDAACDGHLDLGGLTNMELLHITGSLTIMGAFSSMSGRVWGQTGAGVEHMVDISTHWAGTHTSAGTIVISEAATGVCYVKRTA
jgi:hypothetical protein